MSQSLSQIYVHLVFSTKQRKPYLQTAEHRERVHGYLAGICKNQSSPAIQIGGVEDHVHVLCRLGKTVSVSTLVRELKKESSEWIKSALKIQKFYWQSGYGAFSASPSHVVKLQRYIVGQEDHHRKVTFQDEFRRLCKKYGIEIDERYVWD